MHKEDVEGKQERKRRDKSDPQQPPHSALRVCVTAEADSRPLCSGFVQMSVCREEGTFCSL